MSYGVIIKTNHMLKVFEMSIIVLGLVGATWLTIVAPTAMVFSLGVLSILTLGIIGVLRLRHD